MVLCRLAAFPFSLLVKQFGNGTQRIVHLRRRFELTCNVRFKDDHIGTLGVPRGVLAPHTFAEVIFWTHRVLAFRQLPFTLLLHNSSVRLVLLVVH